MQKILIFAVVLLLAGCAHKIDIQQGNVISQETLARVQLGMSDREVIAILGTPLLQNAFRPERWDYHYSKKPGRKAVTRYGATLFFDQQNRLTHIEHYGPLPESDYHRPDPDSSSRM